MKEEDNKRSDRFNEAMHYNLLRKNKQKLKEARIILFLIAGLNLLSLMLYPDIQTSSINFYFIIGYSVFFTILGITSLAMPKQSLITGLIVYLSTILISGIINPVLLFQGILIKIIVTGGLIKGLMSANAAVEQQKKLKEVEARLKT